jgi:ABC-2 type transport system ATP-binding protein
MESAARLKHKRKETAMRPFIRVEGLRKAYGARTALAGVSFSVEEGNIVGLVGPNGSGKTTSFRILLSLATADSGLALVRGAPYSELPAPKRTVGAALEHGGLHPGHTALKHLMITARGLAENPESCERVLNEVNLEDFGNVRIKEFSLGMRQRLVLATALLGRPTGLVLDEPTNGLDPDGIFWLRRFLGGFRDQGGAVLVASHSLGEIETIVDQCVLLQGGEVAAVVDREAVSRWGSLEAVYAGVIGVRGE